MSRPAPNSRPRRPPNNGGGGGRPAPAPRPQRAPAVEVRLRILDGPAAGTEYAIAGSVVRLGRGDENDIVLPDNNCSRVHAELVRDGGGRFIVRDLGSRNGVFVNRKKVPQAPLKSGDRITIGGTSVQFLAGADDQLPAVKESGARKFLLIALLVGGIGFLGAMIIGGGGGGGGSNNTGRSNQTGGNNLNIGGGLGSILTSATPGKNGVNGSQVGRNGNTTINTVPVPSAGPVNEAAITQIMNEADRAYQSGKLTDARADYQQAVKLDPNCERCRNKLDKTETDIKREIESALSAGTRYMQTERLADARRMFEKVKMLDTDASSENNANATRYIEQIDRSMKDQTR